MKICKIFLLAVICLNCAGCFQAETNLKISDVGEVTLKNKFLGVPYIAGIIEETKNNLLKNNPNAKVKTVTEGGFSGYEIEMFFPTMENFAANNIEMYQARPGKCKGIQISDGWFYNSYTFDFIFEGHEVNAQSREAALIAESIISQFKFDFMIELPYAAEISNADLMSNDGKFLKWNIAPALMNGQDKSIQVNFKIYNKLRIAASFFLALIIIAGVIYNLNQAKIREKAEGKRQKEEKNNP